ncbi:purine-nucleoside phosphorylase [Flavobacterium sp.]|uniref:purine-nucleoside phosphorylase n=1 Tax=Flavobacterium sp. TaxID=239 RepID=UPI00286E9774|nr:purine-nucleoside phosphorylase [Flavobacterium sp.]
MWYKVQETIRFIATKTSIQPEYGVILGSGLGGFVDDIEIDCILEYKDIPNFPICTVEGHVGALVFGKIGDKQVVAMQGRAHYYEGYSMQQITFPIRVMKQLGITKMIVSNASGGVNSAYAVGTIVLIKDHINYFPENPLRGINDTRFGPQFISMTGAYSSEMISKAKTIASSLNFKVEEGVYFGLQGPTFENLAEYKMFKILGADCVGMSTVPEVIVARHMDVECFGVSVVADTSNEHPTEIPLSHEEVLKEMGKVDPLVRGLIMGLITQH